MKKKTILILILLLITLCITVQATRMPEIKASIIRYDPMPAVQGSIVKVWVKLENIGTESGAAQIKFVPEYPFSLAEGEDRIKNLGIIPRSEEIVIPFNIMVDLYALNKEYDVKFHYKWTDYDVWAEFSSPIELETTDVLLVVSNYSLEPKDFVPGDTVKIKLLIKNEGISSVKSADIILDTSQNNFFSTLGTGNRKRVGYIEPRESKEIVFDIMINANAEIKLHTLPVKIEYTDDKGMQYSKTSQIGIKINAPPELIMFIDSSEIYSRGTPGKVRAKIVNKGISDLKYVTLKLIKTPEYEILSPTNIAYIGNLDADDFDSAEFIIEPNEKEPKLNFLLEFKDTYNRKYTQEYLLPLRIVSKRALGLEKSKLPMIILILILAGIGYWYYKKKKKKKK